MLRDNFGNLWPYSLKGAEINEGHNLVLLDRNGALSTYLCLTKLKHEKSTQRETKERVMEYLRDLKEIGDKLQRGPERL